MALNETMLDMFWDKRGGGLYFTGKGNEPLIAQSKEIYDGALPSGNSVAASNLLRLGRLTGNIDLEKRAERLIRAFAAQVVDQPMAYTQLLAALDFMIGPSQEIVVAGDPSLETTQAMLGVIRSKFLPNKVLLVRPQGTEGNRLSSLSPFVEAMTPLDHGPTVYICKGHACQAPIKDTAQLESALH